MCDSCKSTPKTFSFDLKECFLLVHVAFECFRQCSVDEFPSTTLISNMAFSLRSKSIEALRELWCQLLILIEVTIIIIPFFNIFIGIFIEPITIDEDGMDEMEPEVTDKILTYDREFLLKFQYKDVCKEKPEGLPDIEVVLDTARGPQKLFANNR